MVCAKHSSGSDGDKATPKVHHASMYASELTTYSCLIMFTPRMLSFYMCRGSKSRTDDDSTSHVATICIPRHVEDIIFET